MTTTVTVVPVATPAVTFIPSAVIGYSVTYPTRNIIHDVIGTATPTATTNGSGLMTGTVTLLFTTEQRAAAATTILNGSSVFQFSTDELTSADMFFVVSGDVTRALDSDSLTAWTVTFEFRQVNV